MPIGPQIPPFADTTSDSTLTKRKREYKDGGSGSDSASESDSSVGPVPPTTYKPTSTPASKSASASISQAAKPPTRTREPSPKRGRVIGPSIPAEFLQQQQEQRDRQHENHRREDGTRKGQKEKDQSPSASSKTADSDDDDDDDDFGPSLPPVNGSKNESSSRLAVLNPSRPPSSASAQTTAQRDEWMTLAPTSDDWSARVDPTKLKSRRFNTGRGAKGPSSSSKGQDNSAWYETPAEKQARLQREMMGIKDDRPSQSSSSGLKKSNRRLDDDERDEETAKRIEEYNTSRGPSLYEAHQSRKRGKAADEDDDPSARAFDREKDIGGGSGSQINYTQRRQMLKKASDFGSRFSKAKYL